MRLREELPAQRDSRISQKARVRPGSGDTLPLLRIHSQENGPGQEPHLLRTWGLFCERDLKKVLCEGWITFVSNGPLGLSHCLQICCYFMHRFYCYCEILIVCVKVIRRFCYIQRDWRAFLNKNIFKIKKLMLFISYLMTFLLQI